VRPEEKISKGKKKRGRKRGTAARRPQSAWPVRVVVPRREKKKKKAWEERGGERKRKKKNFKKEEGKKEQRTFTPPLSIAICRI